ncbi:SGNH hydrolase-type esterase domain-containing protein [Xylaria sp. CBS 124048]|nr:SGNH hydrolase-type esterase domain-containing protein [Xylaria sp. CBS 124048]
MRPILSLPFLPFTLSSKPPAFILAGDSTTAIQSPNGGGWGNGFLSFLNPPAWGVNKGHNGATTASYVTDGDWDTVEGLVSADEEKYSAYVTIQFGHNDQKNTSGVSLDEYQRNLEMLTGEVRRLGGVPLLVTPLTRRTFTSAHTVSDSLHDQRLATIAAAKATNTTYLDLNEASRTYVDAIGEKAAHEYNLNPDDDTHLNAWGSVVFGRMVADLLLEKESGLESWIRENRTLTALIEAGLPA